MGYVFQNANASETGAEVQYAVISGECICGIYKCGFVIVVHTSHICS